MRLSILLDSAPVSSFTRLTSWKTLCFDFAYSSRSDYSRSALSKLLSVVFLVGYISVGSFYTIIYLIDGHLKKSGLFNPERLALLRKILEGILTQFKVVSITDLQSAILDERFSDLEDSCQYYTALSANCDFLLTLNERDFKNVISNRICVLTPERFWTEYMNPIE